MLDRKKINHYLFVIDNFFELKKIDVARELFDVAILEFPNSKELLELKKKFSSTNNGN